MNAVERAIAQRCVADLLEAGYLVSVYHDTQPVLDRSRELAAILTSMGSASEEVLWIRDTKDQRVGWISFRYGSSSSAHVITDYTPNLKSILERANDLARVMRSIELITPEQETNSDRMGQNDVGSNSMDDIIVDRAMVRRLVEDFWRSLVLYGRHLGETQPNLSRDEYMRLSQAFSRRSHERNQATAATMPPEQAQIFLQMIDEEDDICFQEHQHNRDAFYHRLGLNLTSDPKPTQTFVYRRQSLGEMAVRTAVRATIWELIWSVFRR